MLADDVQIPIIVYKRNETPVFLFLLFNAIRNFNVIVYLKISIYN